jgi:hypothetical protein
MNKTEIKSLLLICEQHNLNPKNLKQFNQAIKIYKNGKNKRNN